MRTRILGAILAVTALALLLFAVPLAVVVDRLVDEDATLRVERQAVLAAREVPGGFATNSDPVELPAAGGGVILGLYDVTGRLVSGRGPQIAGAETARALKGDVVSGETAGSRVVAVPVTADERVVGVIRAEQSTAQSDARLRRVVALLVALAVAVVTVGALIGYVVAGRLARPVLRLRDVAVELGNGSFTLDVPTSGVREIDEAGRALAATARRLDDALRRERAFSADASHQLRTPLAGLRTGLETELEFPRPDRTEVLHESLDDIGRLETTIRQLLAIARAPNGSTASASAGAVISAAERAWHGRFAAVGRPLVTAGADRAPMIVGHGAVLGQALDVLLDNSLVHGAGETRIDCDATPDSVTISVSDDGLWSDGDGSAPTHGLGLPLARRLVESLPGRLHIVRDGPRSEVQVVVGRADVDDG